MTRTHLLSAAFVSVLVAACTSPPMQKDAGAHDVQASAPGNAQCFDPNASEQAAGVQATNAARSAAGLSAVRANPTLARAAAAHACDMARRGRMTHIGTSTKGPSHRVKALGYAPRVTAENIAAGPYNEVLPLLWTGSGAF